MSAPACPRPIRLKHRFEALGAAVAACLLARLPLGVLDWAGYALAALAFDVVRIRRRITLANLQRAFPEKTPAQRRRIGRASYRHVFLEAVEFARLSRMERGSCLDHVVEVVHEERAGLLREQGGFVISLGHLGNWEFLAHYWAERGFPLATLYKPMHNALLDARFLETRKRSGVEYISTRLAGRELWRRLVGAIRRGAGVGFLIDQDARRQGIFIPFFGHPASTATGAATLALRQGVPIVPVFCFRVAPFQFRIEVGEPIRPPDARRAAAHIEELTRRQVAALESAIRRAPEQYFWLHNRWKTQPRERRKGDPEPGAGGR